MKATVTLSLHENYVNVVIRVYKQSSMSYVEHSFFGADAVSIIKDPCTFIEMQQKMMDFNEESRIAIRAYLIGFKGHFTFTYELVNTLDVTEFNVTDSRLINPSRGGRSVSGGFKDKLFGKKIFNNLLNSAYTKDVEKLNSVMSALYSIGG